MCSRIFLSSVYKVMATLALDEWWDLVARSVEVTDCVRYPSTQPPSSQQENLHDMKGPVFCLFIRIFKRLYTNKIIIMNITLNSISALFWK